MSAYKGHRGPNVSQYIANLNTLSPPSDLLIDTAPAEEDFSAFLNADFFDINSARKNGVNFDSSVSFDVNADLETEHAQSSKIGEALPMPAVNNSAEPNMEFNLGGDFQFTDFNNYDSNPILDTSIPLLPQTQAAHFSLPQSYGSPTSEISPLGHGFDSSSKKRKSDEDIAIEALDGPARVAAEEDKRRRNTAASARFRVKKKQREQALEKTAKDMSDKVNILETRIQQLETENAWLKGLITEKNGGKSSTNELRALLIKHEEANSGRSSGAHTDGVGTKAQSQKADA